MKLEPMAKNSPPAYPTRNEFLTAEHVQEGHPAVERNSEHSHLGKDLAGAAAFFLAISVGGADTPSVSAADIPPKHTVEQSVEKPSKGMTVVAPIFEHGEGRGSTGCVVVAPPSFLSEEEAMQVIKNELTKHGVKLGDGGTLNDLIVQIPGHDRYGIRERKPKEQLPLLSPRALAVDAIDKSNRIAVEYVSVTDCKIFELPSSGWSSVSRFTPKVIASNLAESAAKSGNQKRYLGFFYDPITYVGSGIDPKTIQKWRKTLASGKALTKKLDTEQTTKAKKPAKRLTYKERKQRSKDESKELLRKQVRDFAVWLEKQGVDVKVQKPKTPPKST